jgi:hypothetical protein
MSRASEIKPTSGSVRPSHIIFLDTETTQTNLGVGEIKHTLKLGYAQYCRSRRGKSLVVQSTHVIKDVPSFWQWVDRLHQPKTKIYLVAHNLNFDLPVLDAFSELSRRGYTLTQFYSKGMTGIFRWRNDSRHLIALDNGNFFAGRLEKWGGIVGLPKLKVDFETVNDDELLTYCMRDVEIMRRLWLTWFEFLDANNCGSFKYTVASTAFNTYRHAFIPGRIYLHSDDHLCRLERDAYHGGRVECFYQGELDDDRYYYLDVNNMYGYVMREHTYPTALWGSKDAASISFLASKLARACVVANVDVKIDDNPYPYKHNGYQCYPIGSFNITLTTPELRYALERDWIRAVYDIAWYKPSPLFKAYIDHFYALRLKYREQGQEGFATIAKLLINSLYGKFGQRGLQQEKIGECDPTIVKSERVYNNRTGRVSELIYLGGSIIETWGEGESYYSFPAIAAHVTAYARMHLFSLIRSVPQKHVYYCDTDSLIVDSEGLSEIGHLLDENQLGSLKIELESDWLIINAPKDYHMENRFRTKGISHNAEQIDDDTYRQIQWRRLRGMIHLGSVSHYRATMTTKHLSRRIHSGVVYPDGWIKPFVL